MPTTNRVERLRFEAQVAELAVKIGGRIAELRKERQQGDPRWTQDYLARQIDSHLTSSQVSRYERGEVKPGDDRLERIAEILGTTVPDLYAGPMSERQAKTSDNGTGPLDELDQPDKLDLILSDLDAIKNHLGIDVDHAERAVEVLEEEGIGQVEDDEARPARDRRSA